MLSRHSVPDLICELGGRGGCPGLLVFCAIIKQVVPEKWSLELLEHTATALRPHDCAVDPRTADRVYSRQPPSGGGANPAGAPLINRVLG